MSAIETKPPVSQLPFVRRCSTVSSNVHRNVPRRLLVSRLLTEEGMFPHTDFGCQLDARGWDDGSLELVPP